MRSGYGCWLAVLLTAIPGATFAADGETDGVSGSLAGWAEIDARGRLQNFNADGAANSALLVATIDQLKRLEFVPAQGATGPVQARAYLTGSYKLQPDGEDLVLTLHGVRTGPKVTRHVMPKPPLRMMIDLLPTLSSRVAFTIQADGRPTDIVIEVAPRSGEFVRELRDAIGKWRFEPMSAGTGTQSTRYRQDIVYYTEGVSPPEMPACPSDTSGNAKVMGQSSCLSAFEIMWSKSKMPGREVRVENSR
jgi:hypothetical protein